MKKIFTLLLLAAGASAASAANFELYFGDTPVKNGDSFTIGYTVETETEYDADEDEYFTSYTYTQNSNLFIKGSAGTPVTVTVKSNETSVAVCSFDGTCEMCSDMNNFTVKKSGTLNGKKMDMQIDQISYSFDETKPAMENIVVEVTVVSGTETLTCTVNMTDKEQAGVSNIVADKTDAVVLTGTTLNYHSSGATVLSLYTVLGSKVKSVNVNGSGSISLASLPKGVYVYRLGRSTGKILVR